MNSKKYNCPNCNKKGIKVGNITLESLLKPDYKEFIGILSYRFCETSNCDVVYYSEVGDQVFYKDNLHVRVGIKEESIPRPVCYCFNHNIEGIELEIQNKGLSSASEDITERLQDGCWCDTRNPEGRCCLGRVRKLEKELLKQYNAENSTTEKIIKDCCEADQEKLIIMV